MNNQWLTRTTALLGLENVTKLQSQTILICGLGGVGGICAEVLARNGINNFILIDRDVVEQSNINRQIIATHKTIGEFKTLLMKERILAINPNCQVQCLNITIDANNIIEVLSNNQEISYLIDAIDDTLAKLAIIKEATNRKINFISSMGTAKKLDPYKLKIIKMNQTTNDPLAAKLRYELRKAGVSLDFKVLTSQELPQETPDRVLGSYMPVTAIAGILLANEVIKTIIAS